MQDSASPDIDIALDNQVLGAQFAGAVNAYLESQGEPLHGIGVIKSNPDQSKHLETATMKVCLSNTSAGYRSKQTGLENRFVESVCSSFALLAQHDAPCLLTLIKPARWEMSSTFHTPTISQLLPLDSHAEVEAPGTFHQ